MAENSFGSIIFFAGSIDRSTTPLHVTKYKTFFHKPNIFCFIIQVVLENEFAFS